MYYFLLCFFGILALARGAAVPEQIHLSLGKLPSQMAVTWTTMQPVEGPSLVHYGLQCDKMSLTVEAVTTNFTFSGVSRYIHRAVMGDLAENTSYDYQVGSCEGLSQVYTFTTLPSQPSPGHPIRVCIFGDFGVDNGVTLPYLVAAAKRRDFDLVIHIGDIAYDLQGKNGTVGDKFLNEIQPIAATIPYMVLAGNHEEDGLNFTNFKERFTMPSDLNDASIYSFDVGPIHFSAVSTEYYGFFFKYGQQIAVNQYAWLEADFIKANANRAKRPFLITLQHRPFYCSSKLNFECYLFEISVVRIGFEDMPGLEQLYIKHKVDIGFAGHVHNYERFYPMINRSYYETTDHLDIYYNTPAPTYVTTGAAGCHSHIFPFGPPPYPASAVRNEHYGYTLLTVYNNTHLHIQQTTVNTTEEVGDAFWYIKKKPTSNLMSSFVRQPIRLPDTTEDSSYSFNCRGERKEECLALRKALRGI